MKALTEKDVWVKILCPECHKFIEFKEPMIHKKDVLSRVALLKKKTRALPNRDNGFLPVAIGFIDGGGLGR